MTSREQPPRRTSSQALTVTREYAPDPARQVRALLRLLTAGDGDTHSHTDATQAERVAKVSRLDPEESLEDVEGKETSCGKIGWPRYTAV
jgi:hypothetical protein